MKHTDCALAACLGLAWLPVACSVPAPKGRPRGPAVRPPTARTPARRTPTPRKDRPGRDVPRATAEPPHAPPMSVAPRRAARPRARRATPRAATGLPACRDAPVTPPASARARRARRAPCAWTAWPRAFLGRAGRCSSPAPPRRRTRASTPAPARSARTATPSPTARRPSSAASANTGSGPGGRNHRERHVLPDVDDRVCRDARRMHNGGVWPPAAGDDCRRCLREDAGSRLRHHGPVRDGDAENGGHVRHQPGRRQRRASPRLHLDVRRAELRHVQRRQLVLYVPPARSRSPTTKTQRDAGRSSKCLRSRWSRQQIVWVGREPRRRTRSAARLAPISHRPARRSPL